MARSATFLNQNKDGTFGRSSPAESLARALSDLSWTDRGREELTAAEEFGLNQPYLYDPAFKYPAFFDETTGRVTDITLSYTYVDPGDGSAVVIPNQLLVEGIVHNHSTEDTQA